MNRRVALPALFSLAIGCGDGTSGWVLTRSQPPPPTGTGASAGTTSSGSGGASGTGGGSAGSSLGGNAGASGGDSGAAGAAGDGGSGSVDPDDFAEVCSPIVTIDNRTASGNGQLFTEALPEPEAFMIAAARLSCALLYKLPEEVPVTSDLTILIDDSAGPGSLLSGGASSTVRLSSLHMRSIADAGGDVALEVSGVSQFLIALDYIRDEDMGDVYWLQSGLGDWVRFEAGFTPLSSRGPGGTWTDGFKTTAFFLDWLDESFVDAAYRLNQSMDPSDGVAWSEQIFVDLAGTDVATLWNDYQASL